MFKRDCFATIGNPTTHEQLHIPAARLPQNYTRRILQQTLQFGHTGPEYSLRAGCVEIPRCSQGLAGFPDKCCAHHIVPYGAHERATKSRKPPFRISLIDPAGDADVR